MLAHANRKMMFLALATLFSIPFLSVAANPEVLGTVVKSSQATLAGVTIPGQGTLTSDAVLSTAKGGSAWVRFSDNTQAGLSEQTSVRFRSDGDMVLGHISSGAIAAKSLGQKALVIETPNFKIEPTPGGRVLYVVAMLPDNSTIVSARRGNVEVTETASRKKHLVPEGHYARISNAAAGAPGQAGGAPAAAAPSGLLTSGPLIMAISVGAGFTIGFGVGEGPLGLSAASPSAP